jgi:hypothetical protein
MPRLGPSISIGANVLATIVSFVFLMIAPFIFLQILFALIDASEIGLLFIPVTLVEAGAVALTGSLLFLVIGVVLLRWQRHRRFASWWPIVLAFPVSWALVLPEAAVRGGSVPFWTAVGTAIALAFCLHWLVLLAAREAMD